MRLNPYSTGSNSNKLKTLLMRSRSGLNPYSTGSNSNFTKKEPQKKENPVLILILLEVTQIVTQTPQIMTDFFVLILILLEVTQIKKAEHDVAKEQDNVLILILLEVTQISET